MLFKVPLLIADISAAMTLEPGDIIATGTPEGVDAPGALRRNGCGRATWWKRKSPASGGCAILSWRSERPA